MLSSEQVKGGGDGDLSAVAGAVLSPEDIKLLTDAYEAVLEQLKLAERSDPVTQLLAKRIIEIGETGLRDPRQICELVVKEFAPE